MDPPSAAVQGVTGQAHHVKWVHDRDRLWQLGGGRGLEPGEAVHGHHFDPVPPRLGPRRQPGLEGARGAALDHVEEPCWADPVPHGGEVDDDRHVLVAGAGVAPDVLVDADHPHPVEAGRVRDQQSLALGQHSVVRGVPRHAERPGDPSDTQMADDERFERPRQRPPRQPRSRRCGTAGVLTPGPPARSARVAAHAEHQGGRPPPERLVRQLPNDTVTHPRSATALPAPPIAGRRGHPAGKERTAGSDPLAGRHQPEGFQAAERGQVGRGEAVSGSSVGHVEVFLMGGVRTPIIGRPRPRRADPRPPAPTPSSGKSPYPLRTNGAAALSRRGSRGRVTGASLPQLPSQRELPTTGCGPHRPPHGEPDTRSRRASRRTGHHIWLTHD